MTAVGREAGATGAAAGAKAARHSGRLRRGGGEGGGGLGRRTWVGVLRRGGGEAHRRLVAAARGGRQRSVRLAGAIAVVGVRATGRRQLQGGLWRAGGQRAGDGGSDWAGSSSLR